MTKTEFPDTESEIPLGPLGQLDKYPDSNKRKAKMFIGP